MEYNSTSECPDVFNYWAGLWALSAAVGRKAWMRFRYGYVYTNLWIVLIGEAGTFKSTACILATKMIEGIEHVKIGPNMTTIEALIKFMPLTEEAFVYKGEELTHQSLAITVPEWTTLTGEKELAKCNILCDLYDAGDRWKKWTVTQGCPDLKNILVTQLAGSTPEQITKCLPTSAIGTGFTSRHIFIGGDPKMAEEDLNFLAEPTNEWDEMGEKLKDDLFDISKKIVGRFRRSPEADTWLNKWYFKNKQGESRIIDDVNFNGYYNRKPRFVLQIAMMLSASRGNSMLVEMEDCKKALQLLDRAEFRMPEAFSGFGLNPVAPAVDAIQRVFRKYGTKEMKVIKISQSIWKQVPEPQIKEAIKVMVKYGMARLSEDRKSLVLGDK